MTKVERVECDACGATLEQRGAHIAIWICSVKDLVEKHACNKDCALKVIQDG